MTPEELQRARPAAEVLPQLIGQKATDELMQRSRQRREFDDLFAYGQARFGARLRSEGLDPDRMSEDELMDYVDRAIHEYRQEQRQKTRLTLHP
jgi:hypothetical protein